MKDRPEGGLIDRSAGRAMILLTLAFIASRALIDRLVPFWFEPLDFYMQYLDPAILRADLARGLLYLHSQPPLFNLFLGLFLKCVPAGVQRPAMALIYTAMGLVTVLGTYLLMRCAGVTQATAMTLSICFLVFPSMIIAERWLFYSCPLAAAMVLSALALYKAIASRSPGPFVLFLALLAGIVLTRSFFHLVFWMIPILSAALRWRTRLHAGRLKVELCLCAVFLLLAASVYFKNRVMFGVFTSSTLQGMNLAGMTRFADRAEIEKLISAGEVTPLARIERFAHPGVYYDYYGVSTGTGVEVLDRRTKSKGAINWNNAIYARASREYQSNALKIIAHDPRAYFKAVLNEAYIFFGFTPYLFFDGPLVRVRTDTLVHRVKDTVMRRLLPPLFGLVFLGILLCVGRQALRGTREGGAVTPAAAALCAYLVFNVLYTLAVACLAELGEGCFMRIPIDPFLCVGLGLAVASMGRRFRPVPALQRANTGRGGVP